MGYREGRVGVASRAPHVLTLARLRIVLRRLSISISFGDRFTTVALVTRLRGRDASTAGFEPPARGAARQRARSDARRGGKTAENAVRLRADPRAAAPRRSRVYTERKHGTDLPMTGTEAAKPRRA